MAEQTMKTTSIYIPIETWKLLRAVAYYRSQRNGGRVSASHVVAEIIERHREELRKETGRKV